MQVLADQSKHLGEREPLTIRRVDAIPVALPLAKPMKMSGVTITHAHNLLVRIEAADGTLGWGEAASVPTMTGDTLGGLVAAVRDHLAAPLIGRDAWMRPALCGELRRALVGNSGAHSAVEMALLDLAARSAGVPVIDLLGGAMRKTVAPMWLIGNASGEQDLAEAHARRQQGFAFFKLKVASKPLADDIAVTHALREALGPDIPLCADANCGFTPAAARRYALETQADRVEFLEQPLDPADLAGLAALTRVAPMPIGAEW